MFDRRFTSTTAPRDERSSLANAEAHERSPPAGRVQSSPIETNAVRRDA
jgi:hypothetical protein